MTSPEQSVSTRVVTVVARKSGVDVRALPPLHESIDPDALDALYAPVNAAGGERAVPTVLFPYAGYEVQVRSATDINVRESPVESEDATDL